MGALRACGPQADLVGELLALGDVDACVNRLKSLPIVSENVSASDRRGIERALRGATLVFGRKLSKFLGGPARDLLEAYMLHYQIDNLTTLFRRSITREEGLTESALYPIKPFYVPDREIALLDSPDKVIALAKRVPLKAMAKEAFAVYQANGGDIFRFELSLDRQYLQLLWNQAGRLDPVESSKVKKDILLPYIGMNAFVWALWLQTYHGMGGQELAGLLPLPRSIMRPDVYIEIARAENVRDAAKAIVGPLRPAIAEILDHDPGKDVSKWDRLSRNIMWRRVSRRDLSASFGILNILAMMIRWELVVDDLITVMNGKALSMTRENIEPLLATKAA
jgi:vacuolar-type H+-ATPase subunit C/Vma6